MGCSPDATEAGPLLAFGAIGHVARQPTKEAP
jgi:hypothetical protein